MNHFIDINPQPNEGETEENQEQLFKALVA